jgi:hypothetical protein
VSHDPRVIAALDDLARELSLYIERSSGPKISLEDPPGSLYETFKSLETSFPQRSGGGHGKPAASLQEAVKALPSEQCDLLRVHLGEGLTCLEIAARSRRNREDVLLDLMRAYGHLRLQLGGEFVASFNHRDGKI